MGGGATRERGRPARPRPGAARPNSSGPIHPKRRFSSPSTRLASPTRLDTSVPHPPTDDPPSLPLIFRSV